MLGLSRTIARQRRDGRLVEVVFSRLASRFDEYDQSTKSPVCLLIDFRVENPRISFICLMNEQSPAHTSRPLTFTPHTTVETHHSTLIQSDTITTEAF
ncbi:hypothetical protein LSH36_12g22003 [Paralvinella palmiformis]|uniref:Uncharacterized protein n=1 Tax=Paralvinella palmiformis TaxID=53620 RepID=A0AAD9KDH1_9ANNE|nr:hypothetical protein LSH36_12g22003 [Paralvinella palmiformis]